MKNIITRFAPSPTGFLHIGNIRTAVFCYFFAKSHKGGKFLLRIDDTDKLRSETKYLEQIIKDLSFLEIKYDELFFQSNSHNIYKKYIEILLSKNIAYFDNGAIKFRVTPTNNNNTIIFKDLIFGELKRNYSDIDDFVIMRKNGNATFLFAGVVDDIEKNISHIIRGADHICNSFKQLLIFKCFNYEVIFAHIPLILEEKGNKVSKRGDVLSNSEIFIKELISEGFTREGIINYCFRLGWGYQGMEYFKSEVLYSIFNLSQIKTSPSKFDIKKLYDINKWHLQYQTFEDYLNFYKNNILSPHNEDDEKQLEIIFKDVISRSKTFKEFYNQTRFAIFFNKESNLQDINLLSEYTKIISENKDIFRLIIQSDTIDDNIRQKYHKKIRKLFTGGESGIPLTSIIDILGGEKRVLRLIKIIFLISS